MLNKWSLQRSPRSLAALMLAPVVVYLGCVMVYPFGWAVYLSLTDKVVGRDAQFIGLGNYTALLSDPVALRAVWNTLLFAGVAVIFKLVFGVVMALALNRQFWGRDIVRSLLFLPWAIPTLVSVLTWRYMLADVGGVVNHALVGTGLIDRPIGWLATPALGMFSVILVNIWRGTPFFGISLLGALQGIPEERYEAARIDGANAIQQFWHVTVPGIRAVAILVTVVSTIWTLNDFEIIWLLTRGGPANTTQVFATYSYTLAFLNLDLGKGIATSLLIFPLLAITVFYALRYINRSDA